MSRRMLLEISVKTSRLIYIYELFNFPYQFSTSQTITCKFRIDGALTNQSIVFYGACVGTKLSPRNSAIRVNTIY